jgi:hypothetical protein
MRASSGVLALLLCTATALSTAALTGPARADDPLGDAQAACGGSGFQPLAGPSDIGGGDVYLLYDGTSHCTAVVRTEGRSTAGFMEADIQVHGQDPASDSGNSGRHVAVKAVSPGLDACVRYGGSVGDSPAADLLYPAGCWG